MRFVDEYRDPAAAAPWWLVSLSWQGAAQEVHGGVWRHTHTIYRHGIENLLPTSVELVHGPGCPCASSRWVESTTRSRWRRCQGSSSLLSAT